MFRMRLDSSDGECCEALAMPYPVSLISLGNRAKFPVASPGSLGEHTNNSVQKDHKINPKVQQTGRASVDTGRALEGPNLPFSQSPDRAPSRRTSRNRPVTDDILPQCMPLVGGVRNVCKLHNLHPLNVGNKIPF